jgi:hypothetical protein
MMRDDVDGMITYTLESTRELGPSAIWESQQESCGE